LGEGYYFCAAFVAAAKKEKDTKKAPFLFSSYVRTHKGSLTNVVVVDDANVVVV
jgi:hypothetical protein